jgi:hypothetical protein
MISQQLKEGHAFEPVSGNRSSHYISPYKLYKKAFLTCVTNALQYLRGFSKEYLISAISGVKDSDII